MANQSSQSKRSNRDELHTMVFAMMKEGSLYVHLVHLAAQFGRIHFVLQNIKLDPWALWGTKPQAQTQAQLLSHMSYGSSQKQRLQVML